MGITPARGQYRKLAELLREAIERGDYPRGSALPSEERLSEQYSLSRPVVNRALAILRANGLVRVERGRGTFVNDIPRINRNAVERQKRIARETGRGAFDAELTQMGLTPRSEPFHVGPAPIPAPAAEILGVETDTEVFARRRHMFANDVPVQLASSYVPNDLAERADLTGDTGAGGLYSRLADIGHGPERFRERVTVRPANEDEVAFLRGELDQPVYEVIRTAFDGEGRPVEVNILIMPVHQWSLTYEWDAE